MIKKILIVDDSIVSRMGIKKCIPKNLPYELHEASDGFEGVKKFRAITPDITFLDLTMPVMTGFEALAEIKNIDKHAIIIVITADIQKKTIEKVLDLGALMVLKKPTTKEDIQDALLKVEKLKDAENNT